MTWTPYGPAPAGMQHKDLVSILAGPSLTPEEAYRRATPAQRRAWFRDEPPIKAASRYDLPPAAPVSSPSFLTPELEAQLRNHQDDHRVPCTHPMANPAETWDGRCIEHKGTPAERAEERRWRRHADATVMAQQLGRATDWAPVYSVGEAEQRASRWGKPPLVEHVEII